MATRGRAWLAGWLVLGACGGSARDAVAPSREVYAGAAPARSSENYDYVAKRSISVVGLAEARGISPGAARAAVDRVADALDTCVTERARAGATPRGAARVVAQIGPDGAVAGAQLRVDPGAGTSAVALLCLVAPARALVFESSNAGARGFAIEALWGQVP
jgi:hypothetical protein